MERAKQTGSDHHVRTPTGFHCDWVSTPTGAHRIVSLAHRLSSAFACAGSLLVVTVVSGFQDHELEAFLHLARSRGATREADFVPGGALPGHLLTDGMPHDEHAVREYFTMLMAFNFEGTFVSADGSLIVHVRDEVVEWQCDDPSGLQGFRETVATLDLEQTEWGHWLMERVKVTG